MRYCSRKHHFTALNWSNKFGRIQHMQFIARNKRKIWKPKQYKITAILPLRNILQLQLRSWFYSWILHGNRLALANLTTSSLKHENFTLSYHSYVTLLQNILQLQLHFSCTLYSINNLRFTKIRVSWNGELPLHMFLIIKCFNSTHIWMELFQLAQFWVRLL